MSPYSSVSVLFRSKAALYLGVFSTREEAATVYDRFMISLHGAECDRLNYDVFHYDVETLTSTHPSEVASILRNEYYALRNFGIDEEFTTPWLWVDLQPVPVVIERRQRMQGLG